MCVCVQWRPYRHWRWQWLRQQPVMPPQAARRWSLSADVPLAICTLTLQGPSFSLGSSSPPYVCVCVRVWLGHCGVKDQRGCSLLAGDMVTGIKRRSPVGVGRGGSGLNSGPEFHCLLSLFVQIKGLKRVATISENKKELVL